TAAQDFGAHAMHDPTEGGLSGGLWEIATAAGVGIIVEESKIPVLPECRAVCDALGLNPLGLLASGSLLITLAPAASPGLLRALGAAGVAAAVIGRVVPPEEGVKMVGREGITDLPRFARDELARFLEERFR
ncbi:MAG: AIR synthase-related protein, partial [Pseudomonadota bacterium]